MQPIATKTDSFSRSIEYVVLWFAGHWLLIVNTALSVFISLPFLAPLLLANGFTGMANVLYRFYGATCHQMPSRAYYLAGEQVAICHRDVAIYVSMLFGGLLFGLVRRRLQPLPSGWYLFLVLPMALDGGLQFLSELQSTITLAGVWLLGAVVLGGGTFLLYRQQKLGWAWAVVLLSGLVMLFYLLLAGPYSSDLFRRNVTGGLFGLSTVWLAYPYFEETATELVLLQRKKLGITTGKNSDS
jgi:uncharacterized membrane protein